MMPNFSRMDFSSPIGNRTTPGQIRKADASYAKGEAKKAPAPKPEEVSKPTETFTYTVFPEANPGYTQSVTTTLSQPETVPASVEPRDAQTSSTTSGTGSPNTLSPENQVQAGPNGTLLMLDVGSPFTTTVTTGFDAAVTSTTTGTTDPSYVTTTVSEPAPFAATTKIMRDTSTKERAHAALLASDIHRAANTTATTATSAATKAVSGGWMSTVSGVGGVLLLAHGISKAITATSGVERLEGVVESNWGAQAAMPTALGEMGAIAAKSLGVVGGTIQAGLGVKKAYEGIKTGDKEKIGIGAAEALAGSCWVLSAASIGASVTGPLFVAITIGAKLYEHRGAIASGVRERVEKLEHSFPKASKSIKSGLKKASGLLPQWSKPGGTTPLKRPKNETEH